MRIRVSGEHDMAQTDDAERGFAGFPPAALAFLRDLAREQNRDWFKARKANYAALLLSPMSALVAAVAQRLADEGLALRGDPERAIFRVQRDVRFSKDKRPYKTHVAAALTRDGEKMSPGVLYVAIDPTGSFAASGFYRPEAKSLDKVRGAIVARPAAFRGVAAALAEGGLTLSLDEDALKRAPRGFEGAAEPDIAEALRRRSFVVRRDLSEGEIAGPGLVATVARFALAAEPLLRFGWSAMAD